MSSAFVKAMTRPGATDPACAQAGEPIRPQSKGIAIAKGVPGETLKKNWRFVVLGFFAVSAILTPPDPFTQVLVATPMVFLYILGLVLTSRVPAPPGPQPMPEQSA